MIDRSGNIIRVGLSPIEREWIQAAITLSLREREQAYVEIAEMTGRKLSGVRSAAKRILAQRRAEMRAFLDVELRKAWHKEGLAQPRYIYVATPTLSSRQPKLEAAE